MMMMKTAGHGSTGASTIIIIHEPVTRSLQRELIYVFVVLAVLTINFKNFYIFIYVL